MRSKAWLFGSACLAAVLGFAPFAGAQAPSADSPGRADAEEPVEVVVTGIRRSLESARNIRRESEQIVDSVVAEDIGKLPDIAVSDTAARIPGIQVVRTGGEASSVLIRGLPDFSTTYNGREIFTAETRLVALQDFPSANIAALEVFKTSTAELVEPGLAGLVNVRSRRPFDFEGGETSASIWALHTMQADSVTPNFNGLISRRWETSIGEIGALVNFSYTEMDYLDSEPSNTDFVADPTRDGQQVRFPDIQRLFYRAGNRERPSANAALQWRPNDTLEFYAEGLWQGFRNEIEDRLVAAPLFNGSSYSDLVFRPGTNVLSSGSVTGLGDPIFTFQGATDNETDTYQFAVGGIYDDGRLRVSADLARTDSQFTGSTASVDRIFANQAGTSIDFDLEAPEFTIRGIDPTTIDSFLFDGFYEEAQESTGEDWQARLDARYRFSETGLLRQIEAGVRYTDRSAHREFGNRFAGFRGQNIPASALPLSYELSEPGFNGTSVQSGFRSFLTPTYDSIRANLVGLRQFVIANGATNFTEAALDAPTLFDATEETLSGYGQLTFGFGQAIDGVVGVRVVQTDVVVTGGTPGPIPQLNAGSDYTDTLPNASLRWRLTPDLQLRLAASKTRTRPQFSELNPSGTLGAFDPVEGVRRGSTGNPFLEPFESNNYDAALEYYFGGQGFASITLFHRDLSGFIQRRDVRIDDPTLGPLIIEQPLNTGEGEIEGVELQAQTFFDFEFLPEWMRDFGIQANATFLDAKTGFPDAQGGGVTLTDIVGVSDFSYNLVGLYEKGPLSARLTFNARSEYVDRRDVRADDVFIEETTPGDRLDFSLNYAFNPNATVFFDWTNILEDPLKTTLSSARGGAPRVEYPRFQRFEETTVSVGLRLSL